MSGSRAFELLSSDKPEDRKTAKRLLEFCDRAAEIGYELTAYTKLRQEYQDIL